MSIYISLLITFLSGIIGLLYKSEFNKKGTKNKLSLSGWILASLIVFSFGISFYMNYENIIDNENKIKNEEEKYKQQLMTLKNIDSLQISNYKSLLLASEKEILLIESETDKLKLQNEIALLKLKNSELELASLKRGVHSSNFPLFPIKINLTLLYKFDKPIYDYTYIKERLNSIKNSFTFTSQVHAWMLGFDDSDFPLIENNIIFPTNYISIDSIKMTDYFNEWQDFYIAFVKDKDLAYGKDVIYWVFSDGKPHYNLDNIKEDYYYLPNDTILLQLITVTFNSLMNNRNVMSIDELLSGFYMDLNLQYSEKSSVIHPNESAHNYVTAIQLLPKLRIEFGSGLSYSRLYKIESINKGNPNHRGLNNEFCFFSRFKLKEVKMWD